MAERRDWKAAAELMAELEQTDSGVPEGTRVRQPGDSSAGA